MAGRYQYVAPTKGVRLVQADFVTVANAIGIEEAALRAFVEVECASKGFDAQGRPTSLFEPHKFYALLKDTPATRKRAVAQGVAWAKWRPNGYAKTPAARWAMYQKAAALNEEAAAKATSWGLGQIMGFNYKDAGYKSVRAMVESFAQSELMQLIAVGSIIKAWKLVKPINAQQWATVARIYNGSGYKKNNYHIKLADAYKRWTMRLQGGKKPVTDKQVMDSTLRIGDRGARVDALIQLLTEKGYYTGKQDGIFGPGVRNAVVIWKMDNELEPVPEMTPQDVDLLDKSEPKEDHLSKSRQDATVKDVVKESPIANLADKAYKGALGVGAVMGGGTAASESGLLDQAQQALDTADQARSIYGRISDYVFGIGFDLIMFLVDHPMLVLIAALGTTGVLAYMIRQARVQSYRKGEGL